ncbi:MAG: DMT family transporter [Melioribacteraceae bacterium]|nr:DMT family transporter [Melioribacteraceae bacterium]MCF8354766.1 DMT family transporter [Melioribacteraceae bacterium]MCF8394391.1 DMT family transporter [Melioribacteraceae bacterium]MCF8417513.1 DMT family transporter [Melioribacteraceae bacterium]
MFHNNNLRYGIITPGRKSIYFSLCAVLFWSTAATAFKLSLAGMNYVQLLFYASAASAIVLFIISVNNSRSELKNLFKGEKLWLNLLLGLLNPFGYYIILLKAYSLLPAQEAQPLNYTWPIAISIFSAIFLRQKLTFKILSGLIIAFFGVIVIATRGSLFSFEFHNLFGTSLAVGSSVVWASFWMIKLFDKRDDSVKLFGAFFFGAIYSGIYILIFDSFVLESYIYLFGALYVGLFEMGITFYLWMRGLQLSPNKAKTSTLAYLSPFVSMLLIALILGEDIYTSSIVGLLLIVSGILFQRIPDPKKAV